MKALPCTSLYESQNGYTPIQACCRCGGGTYEPSRSSIPPPPAPPLVSAEDKCLAMPGCCYSATETCAASSGNEWWDNGERGYNGVRENRPDLPGCCFSPEWRDALSDVDPTPSDLVQARFSGTADGPDDYPSATCTDSDSWPEFTRSSEPSQFWMRQDGDSDAIPGVNLVFCKTQGTPPSHGPGWRWMAPAAGGGLWVLWFLYQCIGQPITGSVYLCCMDKKREGKEPDCPKAAAIIIGGTCLCCAPCICGMICAGAEPIFKKIDSPQMPQMTGAPGTVMNPVGQPGMMTATAMPMGQPAVATATAMPMGQPAVATATAMPMGQPAVATATAMPMGQPAVATATAMPMGQPAVATATAMPMGQPAVATATAMPIS